jgi:general secretion pathway protein D
MLGIVASVLAACATVPEPAHTTSVPQAAEMRNPPIISPKVEAKDAPAPNPVAPAADTTAAAKAPERLARPPSRLNLTPTPPPKGYMGEARVSQPDKNTTVIRGTGDFLKPPTPRPAQGQGDTRLNFENADIRDVVRSILGDMLQENYLVDPAVTGAVTLRSSKGIARADLVSVLEVMLRQVNAILVKDGQLWRVQPSTLGVRGAGRPGFLTRPQGSGYGITFVPLEYIGVNEMMRLLDAIVKEPLGQGGAGGSVRPEPLRNMLIVAGTPQETQYILDTVEMFDVDWMSGMSAGLFTLEHSEAKKVIEEVEKVLGGLGSGAPAPAAGGAPGTGTGPLYGLVRIQLIERLNAILVLSPNAQMISQAETWIRRLDKGGTGDSSRLYVYNLQYTSAEKLAPILQQAMQGRATQSTTTPQAQTAPGQSPLTITTPVASRPTPTPVAPNAQTPQTPARVTQPAAGAAGASAGTALARNATIIADKDRNALLIVASPAEYSAIESAIKRLDVLPRQVMVEVTVVEVDLTDDFSLGVEWAARRNVNVGTSNFTRWNESAASVGRTGLSFALKNRDVANSILNVLDATLNATDSKRRARIHASPKLMAVDNTPVTFNVGRSVSVQTQTVTTPGATTTNSVTNSFQYLQTGISVSITPRISAGGLVNLEITQDISEPTSTAVAGNPNPDISRTALTNTVLAQDGETIVMAGLIREKVSDGTAGLPGVSRIPVIGALFGSQSVNVDKQEILVLVRPLVVSSLESSRTVGDEIRNKMQALRSSFPTQLEPIGSGSVPDRKPLTNQPPEDFKRHEMKIDQGLGKLSPPPSSP